jgi:hypothetical protein
MHTMTLWPLQAMPGAPKDTVAAPARRLSELRLCRFSESRRIRWWILALLAMCAKLSFALDPADPALIPAGRALLNYFESVYKQKTVTAIAGGKNLEELKACCGKYPVILSEDMTGWNSPKYSEGYSGSYTDIINKVREKLIAHHERGGIIEVHFHWPNPFTGKAGFNATKDDLTAAQWNNILTPGTADYRTMIDDLDWHIDRMLKPMADGNIPVLWRPLHEINGGWFWWTCEDDPAKTAKLWRLIFDHMVNKRGLHNLIWVYNDAKYSDAMDWRKPYLPGADYYDIASIDLYQFDARETGVYHRWDRNISYRNVFDMMEKLHEGKMVALGEVQEIPNMEKTAGGDPAFAPWLWACPWWFEDNGDANCVDKPCNPCNWVKQTYLHEFAVTLDEFQAFSDKTVLRPEVVSSLSVVMPEAPAAIYDIRGRCIARESIRAIGCGARGMCVVVFKRKGLIYQKR